MKIREFQEYVKDRLNAVEALVQGGCKAIAEAQLDVMSEVDTHLQTAAGIAVVVTTPDMKRNGCAKDGIPVDSLVAVRCIEIPALNRERSGAITALDAAEIVAHALDGDNIGFVDIQQRVDERRGTITATASFNVCFSLS